eukprot:8077243-Lingulodinium_polyedra.AAC.1
MAGRPVLANSSYPTVRDLTCYRITRSSLRNAGTDMWRFAFTFRSFGCALCAGLSTYNPRFEAIPH